MNTLNFILFGLYLLLTVVLGMWVGRRKKSDAKDYFLAGEGLPWYAIGGSIIAANISTEHFIGMVGVAYGVGFVVAQWEWGNVIKAHPDVVKDLRANLHAIRDRGHSRAE